MTTTLRLISSLLVSIFALSTLPATANEAFNGVIPLEAGLSKLVLDEHMLFLPDLERQYNMEEVLLTETDLPWIQRDSISEDSLREGGLYWFRITLHNKSDQPVELLLQTEYPSINVADLYRIRADGQIDTLFSDAGIEDQFNNRPIPHRNLINTLVLAADESATLIWRIDSEPLLHFRASLWEPAIFAEADLGEQLIHGMVFGVLLVMALYNLFLYFSTWQKSYFYYSSYVLSTLYLLAADQGYIYQYLAPDQVWAKLSIYGIVYAFNALMFGQFTICFLDLRQRSRELLWGIRALAILVTTITFAVIITNSLTLVIALVIAVGLLYLTALAAGILVRKQGVITAGHFIIAIMVLAFSLIASNMASLGMIESNSFTDSLVAVGTTLMLVLLSLALADRINQLQAEVKQANRTLRKANEEKMRAQAELNKIKQLRIKLEQATSQAKLESQSKSDFLATMSHEIRNPMNGVLGMTELMKATSLDEKQTHYLNTIEHSGKALLAIINDLQDFAKIEAGEMELELSSFNLESLIDDCISTFALRAVEKNLNFIADLDPSIAPVLRGDATKLQQIILNLLSNAFKFTEHGDILLVIRRTDKPAVNCIELKFEVHDSGIGLTEEEQERLFTPFQHADERTYGRYGGSGLGLAISKQLAELMDGKIGVSSEPGVGSCFWFTVRLLSEETPDPALIKPKSELLVGKQVLLVDSNTTSADIICRTLRSWNMVVDSCDSADEAFKTASQKEFDVILCDYQLEQGDGLSLAKQLREGGSFRGTFVLMAVSRHLKNHYELSELGIEILLEKPITIALMHDVLKRAVSNHSLPFVRRPEADDNSAQSNLKVLVVEDNQFNKLVIEGLLKQLGITADYAINGLQALTCYEEKPYDLILMDCEMPEMDGYEASAQIRAREQQKGEHRVTIIALSAHARSDYQQRAIQSGMDGYLTKPITLGDLSSAIAEFCVGGKE